jgi:REP element-mobilizing transposase RayT
MPPADPSSPLSDRKSIRLKGFDYAAGGAYYLTICTKDRRCMLGDIRDGRTVASALGALVERCWQKIPLHFPDVVCDEFTLMPNHVHGVLFIFPRPDDSIVARARHAAPLQQKEAFGKPVPASIPTIVRSFKGAATKEARRVTRQPGFLLWHRGYHEHVVRDGADLDKIRRYIAENPAKWECDEENPWRALIRARRESPSRS